MDFYKIQKRGKFLCGFRIRVNATTEEILTERKKKARLSELQTNGHGGV